MIFNNWTKNNQSNTFEWYPLEEIPEANRTVHLEAGTSLGGSLLSTDCSLPATSHWGSRSCLELHSSICFPLPPTRGFPQLEPNGKPPWTHPTWWTGKQVGSSNHPNFLRRVGKFGENNSAKYIWLVCTQIWMSMTMYSFQHSDRWKNNTTEHDKKLHLH